MASALAMTQIAPPSMAAPITVLATCSSLPTPNSRSASWPRWIRRITTNEKSSTKHIKPPRITSATRVSEPPRIPIMRSQAPRRQAPDHGLDPGGAAKEKRCSLHEKARAA
jgi:hypothetical protein